MTAESKVSSADAVESRSMVFSAWKAGWGVWNLPEIWLWLMGLCGTEQIQCMKNVKNEWMHPKYQGALPLKAAGINSGSSFRPQKELCNLKSSRWPWWWCSGGWRSYWAGGWRGEGVGLCEVSPEMPAEQSSFTLFLWDRYWRYLCEGLRATDFKIIIM